MRDTQLLVIEDTVAVVILVPFFSEQKGHTSRWEYPNVCSNNIVEYQMLLDSLLPWQQAHQLELVSCSLVHVRLS